MTMTGLKRLTGATALAVLLFAGMLSTAEAVDVRRVVSPGGIEAWLVEDHSNPIISVEIAFRDGGSVTDPEGKEGLANMVSGLIDEGAGEFDSQSFRREMENRSIKLSFSAGLDRFFGGVQTLSEHSEKAFELLRLALLQPRFDEEPVERIRSQIMARLARDADRQHR